MPTCTFYQIHLIFTALLHGGLINAVYLGDVPLLGHHGVASFE